MFILKFAIYFLVFFYNGNVLLKLLYLIPTVLYSISMFYFYNIIGYYIFTFNNIAEKSNSEPTVSNRIKM